MLAEENNIYGYLRPANCLKVAQSVFRDRLGIPAQNVTFQSGNNGNSLVVSTEIFELYSGTILKRGIQFIGFVSGSKKEILNTLNEIVRVLKYAKIESEFEIYDEEHNCIATINSTT